MELTSKNKMKLPVETEKDSSDSGKICISTELFAKFLVMEKTTKEEPSSTNFVEEKPSNYDNWWKQLDRAKEKFAADPRSIFELLESDDSRCQDTQTMLHQNHSSSCVNHDESREFLNGTEMKFNKPQMKIKSEPDSSSVLLKKSTETTEEMKLIETLDALHPQTKIFVKGSNDPQGRINVTESDRQMIYGTPFVKMDDPFSVFLREVEVESDGCQPMDEPDSTTTLLENCAEETKLVQKLERFDSEVIQVPVTELKHLEEQINLDICQDLDPIPSRDETFKLTKTKRDDEPDSSSSAI